MIFSMECRARLFERLGPIKRDQRNEQVLQQIPLKENNKSLVRHLDLPRHPLVTNSIQITQPSND